MQDQDSPLARAGVLFQRLLAATFAVMVVLAMLYVAGNFQGFADATQRNLLRGMRGLAAVCAVGLAVSLPVELVVRVRPPGRLVARALFLLAGAVVAALVAWGGTMLLVLQEATT